MKQHIAGRWLALFWTIVWGNAKDDRYITRFRNWSPCAVAGRAFHTPSERDLAFDGNLWDTYLIGKLLL